MLRTTAAILILAAAPFLGCERQSAPETAPAHSAAPSSQQATEPPPTRADRARPAPAEAIPEARGILNVAGLIVPIPEGWEEVPPANAMRLAELRIPGEPEPTTITFITAGGDVRANLDRWAAQFSGGGEPSFDSRTVAGMSIHTAEMHGTYSNIGEPPREGFALRGAVIEGPSGSLFIKMTGPAEQVASETEAFYGMIEGARPG